MSANPSAEEKELQSQLASAGAADDPYFEIRHSCAHVLAAALKRLFPGTRLGIGPPVEDGFYYDVQPPRPLSADDLPVIETEMKKIVAEGQSFERSVLKIEEARRFFMERDEPFKVEIIDTIAAQGDETVSLYRNGDFVDLCRGRHVQNTNEIAAFKLMSLAGAYWRGNENNPQLTRVYGTAWRTPEELADYLHRLEEAEKRDHRKLG